MPDFRTLGRSGISIIGHVQEAAGQLFVGKPSAVRDQCDANHNEKKHPSKLLYMRDMIVCFVPLLGT